MIIQEFSLIPLIIILIVPALLVASQLSTSRHVSRDLSCAIEKLEVVLLDYLYVK